MREYDKTDRRLGREMARADVEDARRNTQDFPNTYPSLYDAVRSQANSWAVVIASKLADGKPVSNHSLYAFRLLDRYARALVHR